MSTHSVSLPTEPREHADTNKFWAYVQIAMLLAVITGVEIVAIGLPFAAWLLISALVILSLVKFLFVIFYFMHLRWDKVFCTILFFIGLVLAGGTMWALLRIFGVEDSKPLSAASAVDHPGAPAISQVGDAHAMNGRRFPHLDRQRPRMDGSSRNGVCHLGGCVRILLPNMTHSLYTMDWFDVRKGIRE